MQRNQIQRQIVINEGIRSNIDEQVRQYESILDQGYNVVVVAHSQGNLFTNAVYERLMQNEDYHDRVSVIAVASPANHVAGNGPHVTLESDRVINLGARFLHGDTLPANSNTYSSLTENNHEFVKHYLNANGGGDLIAGHVIDQMRKLQNGNLSKECIEWFQNLSIPKYGEECMNACPYAPTTGMADYDCTNDCDYLCNCIVSD